MLQQVSRKFRSGCMMLARDKDQTISFLGSAFLVHNGGYLLTAAHLTADETGLVVVWSTDAEGYVPLTFDRVAAIPVKVVARDDTHDVALLRIDQEIDIKVPDDFLGSTDDVRPGASVMALGFSFGHHQIHSLLGYNAVVSAKVRSNNDTALILYDSAFHEGDRGGPLVHVTDGQIIGIIDDRFEPSEIAMRGDEIAAPLEPREINVSYAVSIEYGLELMRKAGLIHGFRNSEPGPSAPAD